jgi:large subunit ribosomal protein L20|uniref:50S ribosomal protein L20 n=1 Tax=Galdieria yellowstonensis TaxID=3028027 RepID=A0A9Y1I2S2_9RHOD|nr:ribosomal protein L20 [Galdieria yellowstonensis]WDA99427.1 ribosomal protein L20 [Galdieria yellowstonensis]
MTRVKRGNVAIKRRKKILRLAKGYRGSHSKLFRIANQQVMKALKYAYRGRKLKKRNFRSLWIVRINAALRQKNLKYNNFIAMLKQKNIGLNRKVLSQLAVIDNETFDLLIEKVKK